MNIFNQIVEWLAGRFTANQLAVLATILAFIAGFFFGRIVEMVV